jgi:hypothetical protein
MTSAGLGRRVPTTWKHVEKYPIRKLLSGEPITVEDVLPLPPYRAHYDQGQEGACVGFSLSWMMSVLNRRLYNARNLYTTAQTIDEWDDTPPGEGTSVRAGCDVLRQVGHWQRLRFGRIAPPGLEPGISENRWATQVDELRECIHKGIPFVLGVNWYQNFDTPVPKQVGTKSREFWIGNGSLGRLRGGHAICGYAASDKRQAFKLVNSWGISWPLVWIGYDVVQRLLDEEGEACLVVDRP